MTLALTKGHPVVTAGLAAITGAGVALGFTVFDNASTWLLILLAVITLASPVVAGWLSPGLKQAWFFPIGVLAGLSIATAIYGPLFRLRAYRVRRGPHVYLWWRGICGILRRLDSEAVPSPCTRPQVTREPPVHSVAGGSLLLDSPHCALHRYTASFIDFNALPLLAHRPAANWIDRGRCGVCDHLERP